MLDDRAALIKSLCFTYRLIVASVPLLRFAAERAEGDLLLYYQQHIAEEAGHDDMLLNDLKGLGVEEIPHSFEAAQAAGSQYYFIAHDHPAMLLGYMHALERDSLPVEYVDALSAFHAAPLTALRHHALHDPLHRVDLAALIATLDPALRRRVAWNEMHVRDLIERAMS